jgi:hypothetical protein
METRNVIKDELTELKVFILRQQERAAELERAGKKQQARAERNRLYPLLHRLDVLETAKQED